MDVQASFFVESYIFLKISFFFVFFSFLQKSMDRDNFCSAKLQLKSISKSNKNISLKSLCDRVLELSKILENVYI